MKSKEGSKPIAARLAQPSATKISPVALLTDPELAATMHDIAGQLAPLSVKTYENDVRHLAGWLAERGLAMQTVGRSQLIEYRQHLAQTYAKATAARMLTVARRLLGEAVKRGVRESNPASDIRGFKTVSNETPHTALTVPQAEAILAAIDCSTALGKRDYALIAFLLSTGVRRAECADLNLGDLNLSQGHHIALIRHGKGDKRRVVKMPVPVVRLVESYLAATGRSLAEAEFTPDAPLWVSFRRGDHPTDHRLTKLAINETVEQRAATVGIKLSPHGLRASFVTLALEGGAKLQQVQYASGHADPRTTERYQKRKLNLDDNAVDYLRVKMPG